MAAVVGSLLLNAFDSHMMSSTAPSTNTAASTARMVRRRRLAFGSSSSGSLYSS